jgi:hypothetical protein
MKDKNLALVNSREERIGQLRAAIEAQETMRGVSNFMDPQAGPACRMDPRPRSGKLDCLAVNN